MPLSVDNPINAPKAKRTNRRKTKTRKGENDSKTKRLIHQKYKQVGQAKEISLNLFDRLILIN